MESNTSEPRAALKEKLLRLLQTGTTGIVLASAILDVPSAPSTPSPDPQSRQSIEQRVDQLRRQIPAEPGFDASSAGVVNLLAWYNWHNWRNGWHNGWHNWHNWHNWW